MSPRRIISFSGRLVRIAAYVVVAAVVLFYALTRTEVGREGLRDEVVRQFNRSMYGSLEIGKLSGNVLNRLSARDVVVRDSLGRPVISIDSVVLHPSWSAAFRRTFSTGRVTLIRPEVLLSRSENGRWNIQSALQSRSPGRSAEPWSFRAARIDVVDGRVATESTGGLPAAVRSGAVFDWTNAEFDDVDGRALVDWDEGLKLIDVIALDGRLTGVDIDVDRLHGQVAVRDGRLALNDVHLRTALSALRFNASVAPLRALFSDPGTAVVDLDLASSTIDGDELARLLPAIPIRSSVTAEARVQGPLGSLVVEDVSAGHGDSRLSLEGTITGLPDSVDYDAALRTGSVRWRDVQAVWPQAPIPSFEHLGAVDISGDSKGSVRFGRPEAPLRWTSTNEIRVESGAGHLSGTAELAVGGRRPARLDGVLDLEEFDAGRMLNRSELASRLNGRITVDAEGLSLRDAEGRAAVSLGPSVWAARRVDTLRADVAGSLGALEGSVFAVDGAGNLDALFRADLAEVRPSYRVDGRVSNVDLGPLVMHDSVSSALNLQFAIDGHGRTWTGFEGDVEYAFEPSRLSFGRTDRQIPAHTSRLIVRQHGDSSPRVAIRGDVVDVDVVGDVDLHPLIMLGRYWVAEVARSAAAERAKPYRLDSAEQVTSASSESAGDVVPAPSVAPQSVQLRLRVRRSDILSALFPMLPALHTDLRGEGRVRLEPDVIQLQLQMAADSLVAGAVDSRGLDVSLSGSAHSGPAVSQTMVAHFSASASALLIGEQTIEDPSLSVAYRDRGFDLAVDADTPGASAPHFIRARMDLLDDRNRLVIQDFQATAADQVWTAPGMNIVDFFREAVYVRGIRIQRANRRSETGGGFLQVSGTLSSAMTDTLFLHAEDIRMQHVGSLVGLEDVGGRLDGRLAFTGLNRRPELTGRVDIEPLSYRNRHLGRLSATSRYIPGSPDVALRAELSPVAPEDSSLLVEDSDLSIDGTFRLPIPGRTPDLRDAGSLDLNVDVRRADAFFFDYVFRDLVADVTGYIDGSGHIGGTFDSPIFDAELAVRDARFRVPDFGLRYAVDGPVVVDREGIHLNELNLRDADDGRAVVRGSVLFNAYRFFSFDLHADLDDVVIMNVQQSRELPFYGRILASGDVSLTGPLSNAMLHSANARTSPDSDLFVPISESGTSTDAGFIVFADSTGQLPDFERLIRRSSLLAERPAGERPFLDGLGMDLNILAPEGSTVHLVIDPLLGDVINAVGSGRIQLVRSEGEFSTFGTFTVSSGDYLFTAGDVFFRRFLIDSGTITWDGDPLNAMLAISASYRTRASTEGLGLSEQQQGLIPLVIELDVSGRVATPIVDLALSIDRADRNLIGRNEGLEAVLNQPEQAAQYATSVLLTNSFLLTATADQPFAQRRGQLAFNSLSQLVASQLNRYMNYALPNVDLSLGVQGESAQDLDVTYGVALRLLDERLIIRGQGIYQNDQIRRQQQGVLDEFVVEVRLNPRVAVEVFYRREGDILTTEALNTSTTGAGLSYQTEFSTWRRFIDLLFGWMYLDTESGEEPDEDVVAGASD